MSKQPMTDIVVVLPGILGSALEKDGKPIWDMSPSAAVRALFTLGGSVKDLELDGDDHTIDDLGDGVRATRLLPDLHLVPGLWKIDGYGAIADRLQSQFDLAPGHNYFEFPYDWRRDNRVAARRLARESHDWLKAWREKTSNDEAKLVLLAHSMGGLVSRAFLELEDGWRDTRTLVTFGTPFRGSLNAAGFIANGFEKKIGPLTAVDLTDMLRSLTSVYQLLPIYPCIEDGGGAPVRPSEATGFPHLDADRAGEALAFHRAIEEAVSQHSGETAYVEDRYRLEPVVGTDQPTLNSGRIDGDRLILSHSINGDRLL
jgi:pimeloyl-ACP methyl ester carboxylesterase